MKKATKKPKAVVFDLDGTLTPSKSPIQESMASLICQLLEKIKVGVISGGKFSQIKQQFLKNLPSKTKLENLFLIPLSGGEFYFFNNTKWEKLYKKEIKEKDKERIKKALKKSIKEWEEEKCKNPHGEIIQDRGGQITFSALGNKASLELKKSWDPDYKKRKKLVEILKKRLPDFEIQIGGTTSIDITLKGVNKAFGIKKFSGKTNIPLSEIVFVGDALEEGGNDAKVKILNIETIHIKGPKQTKKIIKKWLE